MDFLKIRKKAKERAAGQGASSPAPGAADAPARAPPEAAGERPSSQVASAGTSGARGRAGAQPTRRSPVHHLEPGSDARPEVLLPRTAKAPRPDATDFAVYDPSRATQVPEPAIAAPRAPAPALAPLPPDSAPARAERREPQPPSSHDPLDEFFFRQDETVAALTGLPAEPAAPAASRRRGRGRGGVPDLPAGRGGVRRRHRARARGAQGAAHHRGAARARRHPGRGNGPGRGGGDLRSAPPPGPARPRRRSRGRGASSSSTTARAPAACSSTRWPAWCGCRAAASSPARRGSAEPAPIAWRASAASGAGSSRCWTCRRVLRRGPAPERGGRRAHAGA